MTPFEMENLTSRNFVLVAATHRKVEVSSNVWRPDILRRATLFGAQNGHRFDSRKILQVSFY